MRREGYDVSTLEQFVGQEMGVSDWPIGAKLTKRDAVPYNYS